MIAYFPTAYPDELLYSQLARYYTKSGYMAYTFAAEDLFMKKNVRPDIEFVNVYTPSAIKVITRAITMEEVVMQHTMFPLYGRFLPRERRSRAFRSLVDMAGGYHNLLPIPQTQNGKVQCLRYCPMCAECDRNIYGETYWHRVHQMIGVHVCPIHRCYLMNSSVAISGKSAPCLKTAEEVMPSSEAVTFTDNEIEIHIAEYMTAVFQADIDMDSCTTARPCLKNKTCTKSKSAVS